MGNASPFRKLLPNRRSEGLIAEVALEGLGRLVEALGGQALMADVAVVQEEAGADCRHENCADVRPEEIPRSVLAGCHQDPCVHQAAALSPGKGGGDNLLFAFGP